MILTEDFLKQVPVDIICPDAPAHVKNGLDAINYLKECLYENYCI